MGRGYLLTYHMWTDVRRVCDAISCDSWAHACAASAPRAQKCVWPRGRLPGSSCLAVDVQASARPAPRELRNRSVGAYATCTGRAVPELRLPPRLQEPVQQMQQWLRTTGSPASTIDRAEFSEPESLDSATYQSFEISR